MITKYCTAIFSLFLILSCNSQDKKFIKGESKFQREMNAEYKDASKSPLTKKDLKAFDGLDFYPIDSSFIVKANIILTPNDPFFEMPTTTERKPVYRRYGILHFNLKGKEYQLNLYKNQKIYEDPKYKNYLFLPFTDASCGTTSYSGGRYIDVFSTNISKENTLFINFNNAYNPYCAYNSKYSCPVVPEENHLDVKVLAGVMAFKKH